MANVVVMSHGETWVVRVNGSAEVEDFHTQDEALTYAHEQAKLIHGYVLFQNEEGELVQEASYRPLGMPDEETDIALDRVYKHVDD